MTTREFSNLFDTLLNSYANTPIFGDTASRQEITLDEYEKSVFLTQAQDIIVKQYFERTNATPGFDDSERRQIDFSSLITTASVGVSGVSGFAENSWLISFPSTNVVTASGSIVAKPLFILNEKLVLSKNDSFRVYVVVPINYDEYSRQISKPFAQPLKKQAWRLIQDDNSSVTDLIKLEIIPTDAARRLTTDGYTATYKVRFVRRPCPIVLENLTNTGLSVDGTTAITECELNPILHMDILNKAVELAYITKAGAAAREQKQ